MNKARAVDLIHQEAIRPQCADNVYFLGALPVPAAPAQPLAPQPLPPGL